MDDREVIEIFHRMNSTYYQLNSQELRNSQYFGAFKTLAYTLAGECLDYWREWKVFSEDDISRMKEVKLTSEIIMMMVSDTLLGSEEKKIDDFYKKYDSNLPKKENIFNNFHQTMKVIDDNFKDFLPFSIFSQQTKIYVFFCVIYYVLFKLNISLQETSQNGELSLEIIEKIKIASIQLKNKEKLPENVLKALTSRRQGINDRQPVFNYLIGKLSE